MGQRYQIKVEDTGECFSCTGEQAVLAAMLRARRGPLDYGCCGGGCGVCRMRIVSGEWTLFRPMSRAHVSESDLKQGIALLCCVQPRSDMVIARV
ncbi:MAG: 2Fe-2S iron-sulfur cluster binding domain-containing protein [Treponema sp.]|jgi:ferredoxin|nr:2Fe-2S iron-sulfur cluster binding domain-containing protein [Treponema sp.]